MSLFSKKKGASSGSAGGANNTSPQERKKIPKPTEHQFLQSGQMNRLFLSDGEVAAVFEGEMQGRNPLAWDDMPASLKAQFPHWKDSTPAIKCHSPDSPTKKSPSNTSDMVFQFSAISKHQQPQHTIPYRVMDRDTLNSVALKFHTTPSKLAHLNRKPPGLSFPIFPGEVLYIPDGEEHPAEEPPPQQGKDALRSLTNSVEREEGRHSPTSRAELMAEWSTGVGEAVSDTQLTIASKYITDDQGCVHGMLLLSSSALLFHPHTVDPIVMERGKEGLEMLTPLENMAYATLTKECCPPARRSVDPDGRHQCRHTVDAHLRWSEAQPTGNHNDGSRRDVSPTPGGDSLLSSLAKEQPPGEDPVITLAIDRRRDDNTVLSSSGAFSSESHASGGSVHAAAETLQPSGAVTNSLEASGRSNSNGEASTEDLLLDECSKEALEEEGPVREKKTEEEGALDDEYYGVDSLVFLHVHLASHTMGSHTYKPLDTKVRGIDIPHQQRRAHSLSPSIQHVKTKFCFAVPKRRIDDLATFLGSCHPDAQVPADLPSDPTSWTHGLFNIVGDASDLEEEYSIPSAPAHAPISGRVTPPCLPKGNKTIIPTSRMQSLPGNLLDFIDDVEIIHCSHRGGVYYNPLHGITLRIPYGAIPKGVSLEISIGVSLYGNFGFPSGLSPVSSLLWLCTPRKWSAFNFLKPIEVIIPHFLACTSKEDAEILGMCFMKAPQCPEVVTSAGENIPVFCQANGEVDFTSIKGEGILHTRHFCSLCIMAGISPEHLCKRRFHILCAVPRPIVSGSNVYFYVTYFIRDCILSVEKKLGSNYDVSETRVFSFTDNTCTPDVCSNASITAEYKCNPTSTTVCLQPSEITQGMVDFWQLHKNDELELMEERNLYPPRMKLTIGTKETEEQLNIKILIPSSEGLSGAIPGEPLHLEAHAHVLPSLKDVPKLRQLILLKNPEKKDEEPLRLIQSLSPQWAYLSNTIDFDSRGSYTRIIYNECSRRGELACCERVLMYWLEGRGDRDYQPPSWASMITLLGDVQETNLAQKLRTFLSH